MHEVDVINTRGHLDGKPVTHVYCVETISFLLMWHLTGFWHIYDHCRICSGPGNNYTTLVRKMSLSHATYYR